jgi:hypothetical protein
MGFNWVDGASMKKTAREVFRRVMQREEKHYLAQGQGSAFQGCFQRAKAWVLKVIRQVPGLGR